MNTQTHSNERDEQMNTKNNLNHLLDAAVVYKSELEILEVLISPDMAQALLDGHQNYRSIQTNRVANYADVMSTNDWLLSPLLFDINGNLIDGQHRLKAVISSNTNQCFACIMNWPTGQESGIDGGYSRSRAQEAKRVFGLKSSRRSMALTVGLVRGKNTGLVLNSRAMQWYAKYRRIVDLVISELRAPLSAVLHGIPFARAICKFSERQEDILTALKKMREGDWAEPRMNGLRLYFMWAVTQKRGVGARSAAYTRCSQALLAYLNNQTILRLRSEFKDPFCI